MNIAVSLVELQTQRGVPTVVACLLGIPLCIHGPQSLSRALNFTVYNMETLLIQIQSCNVHYHNCFP